MKYYLNPRKAERDFFDDFFSPSIFNTSFHSSMKTDITEKDSEYVLEMELAGYNKDDVKISLEDGYLKVEAEKKVEKDNSEDKKYVHKERYYGSQSRSFYVGNIDQNLIKANFNNGILEISVPKEEMVEEKNTKYIDIK